MCSKRKSFKIPVVVVESHQHVLYHIHHVLRKQKVLLKETWTMLHFDAHPDLACPHSDIPAAACFQPRKCWSKEDNTVTGEQYREGKDLYELLDSTSSGIAEWILPLVLAANLETVHWIHPSELNLQQLPDGEHQYHVGAWIGEVEKRQVQSFLDLPSSAVVKVDWDNPYYSDDDTYAPLGELHLPRKCTLRVSELSADVSFRSAETPWVLDICLDYFICRNPFLFDIDMADPVFCKALSEAVLQSAVYERDDRRSSDRRELLSFRQHLGELLRSLSDDMNIDSLQARLLPLFSFYSSPGEAKEILGALTKSLQNTTANRSQLITLAIEALPNMTMPHSTKEPTKLDTILPSIEEVYKAAGGFSTKEPFIITIARSSDDGFTPPYIIEELQASILQRIHGIFCACDQAPVSSEGQSETCRLQLVFDYGRWEGSTIE